MDEKADILSEREEALKKREAEVLRRELRQEAGADLERRGLPKGLCDMLDYADRQTCSMSIDRVERLFREAVQQGVDSRLKDGIVPLRTGGAKKDFADMTDEEYYAATLR